MESTGKISAQERIDAAQKRRQDRLAKEAEAKLEQQAADLEAIADLEEEFGHERVIRIELGAWTPGMGAPTSVAVRVPLGSEMNCAKFIERINKAKEGSKERLVAQDDLAKECWVYPPKGSDAYKAALEVAPLILSHSALQIVKASQGVAESEGKG